MKIQYFLLFFLIFPTIFSLSEHFARNYTFTGTCPTNEDDIEYHNCLSYSNSSIIAFLKEYQVKNSCVNELNALLYDINSDLIVKTSIETQKNGTLGLFSKKYIAANEPFLNIDTRALVSNRKIERKIAFPALNPREFPYQDLDFENSLNEMTDEFKFIHNIFFYFGFIDEYIYKQDLLCLPTDIDIPLFTFSFYEVDYLLSSELANIVHERKQVKEAYYYFKKIISANYNLEQRKLIFRGQDEPSLDDFIYVYYLLKSQVDVDPKKKFIYIQPIIHYARTENFISKIKGSAMVSEFKENYLLFQSKKKLLENVEILRPLPRLLNRHLFLYEGVIPDESDINCMEIVMFSEDIAKEVHDKTRQCVSLGSLYKFRYFFVFGTILNMNGKTKKKCEEFLRYQMTEEKSEEERRLDELIDGKFCPYVPWKTDIWEKAKDELKEMTTVMKENVKVSGEYWEFRSKSGLNDKNALLLNKYYQKNLELLQWIQEEIRFYDTLNKERTRKTEF